LTIDKEGGESQGEDEQVTAEQDILDGSMTTTTITITTSDGGG